MACPEGRLTAENGSKQRFYFAVASELATLLSRGNGRIIFRRLADAISEQNWFTVLLEVLIIFVGIFIGLQVDRWKEGRKDRHSEIEYLQRIETELGKDIAEFETSIRLASRRLEYARLTIAAVNDPESARREPTGFVRALVRAGFTYSPVVSDHTFEEIKSAGELSIIRQVELRIAITEYYQQVRQYGQWNYIRELNQTEYLKRQAGILTPEQFQAFWVTRHASEIPEDEAVRAFEKMLTRPAFIDWLPMVVATLTDARINYEAAKDTAEDLRHKIATSLGRHSINRSI